MDKNLWRIVRKARERPITLKDAEGVAYELRISEADHWRITAGKQSVEGTSLGELLCRLYRLGYKPVWRQDERRAS